VKVLVITIVVVVGFIGLLIILFRLLITYQRNVHIHIYPIINNSQQTNIALGEAGNETKIDIFNSIKGNEPLPNLSRHCSEIS
jgi:hypothetical protein